MFSTDPRMLALQIGCLVLGAAIATGGGLLALVADTERPLQCFSVLVVAMAVFLGGLALLCWFQPVAALAHEALWPVAEEGVAVVPPEIPTC